MVGSRDNGHDVLLQPSRCSSWVLRYGMAAAAPRGGSGENCLFRNVKETIVMYNIFWIIGVIVVVLAILSFIGLR